MADRRRSLLAGAFVGGMATGGAGFAFAVVASAIWLHVIDPVRATFLIVFCGTVMQISLIWPMRHNLQRRTAVAVPARLHYRDSARRLLPDARATPAR